MLYLDSSALIKRYIDEHNSMSAIALMEAHPVRVSSRLAEIEVRRNLKRLLTGEELRVARAEFDDDLNGLVLVSISDQICADAAYVAERTGCRSLDSIHIATARALGPDTSLLTYDRRQAEAALAVGLTTVGS